MKEPQKNNPASASVSAKAAPDKKAAAGKQETNEVEVKVENCEEMKQQCEEMKSKWLRAVADYQNLQKEVAAQRGEWIRMSELQVIEEFLPVYSNFRKAFAVNNEQLTMNKEQASWVKGIEYIMKQFGDVLKAHGVEEIKTVGEMFDPTRHEAVGEEEAEEKKEGEIFREVEAGYKMKGRIIKVAKVVVAKKLENEN